MQPATQTAYFGSSRVKDGVSYGWMVGKARGGALQQRNETTNAIARKGASAGETEKSKHNQYTKFKAQYSITTHRSKF